MSLDFSFSDVPSTVDLDHDDAVVMDNHPAQDSDHPAHDSDTNLYADGNFSFASLVPDLPSDPFASPRSDTPFSPSVSVRSNTPFSPNASPLLSSPIASSSYVKHRRGPKSHRQATRARIPFTDQKGESNLLRELAKAARGMKLTLGTLAIRTIFTFPHFMATKSQFRQLIQDDKLFSNIYNMFMGRGKHPWDNFGYKHIFDYSADTETCTIRPTILKMIRKHPDILAFLQG